MSTLEIMEVFKELFVDSFSSKPQSIDINHCFYITEDAPESHLKRVEIRKVPECSILLKMQNYKPPTHVFKSTGGKCKMCDYILIALQKRELYFVFIEMKSQKPDSHDFRPQFMGGDCFMDYCIAMVEKFHDTHIPPGSLIKRNILLHTPRLNKKATKEKGFKNNLSSVALPSGSIVRVPCTCRNGKAFAFFERLVSDHYITVEKKL